MKRIIIAMILLTIGTNSSAERILAACTDYSTGMLSSLEAADPWTPYADELSIHSDTVLRWGGEYLALVERYGVDAIRVLDPQTLALQSQFSTGAGSNPQDLIIVDGKAYISCNNTNDILIVDWPSGELLGLVDLSGWADSDGLAEPAGMVLADGLIFIAIQRLDRNYYWLPVGDSYLAVLDPSTDALVDVNPGQEGVQAIALPASNPAGELHIFDGRLWLNCVANFGLQDGGLVRVDPLSFSTELVLSESEFGGDLGDVGFLDATHAWAIVTDASFNTHLYRFDPSNLGTSPELILAGGGWIFTDLEIYDGVLFLADQSYGSDGVRVLDATTGDALTSLVNLGLPPYDLLASVDSEVNAPEPPAFARLSAWPNPFNPKTTIRFELAERAEASLSIFDSVGRRVRELSTGTILDAGAREVTWDGKGDHNASLPSGIYHARLFANGQTLVTKLVLLK
jgi:hypothetical protein